MALCVDYAGSTCTISNLCGEDGDKYQYYVSEEYQTLSCTDDGSWQNSDSATPITNPVCIAKPCTQQSVSTVNSSVSVECKIEGSVVTDINGRS